MRIRMRSCLRDKRGVTAVEFAIIGPLAILVIFFVIEVGWQLITTMALQSGAHDAVRFAMTGQGSVPDLTGSPSCRAQAIIWLTVQGAPNVLVASNLVVQTSTSGATAVTAASSSFGGAASQIVIYQFTYSQPYLTPIGRIITGTSAMLHSITLLVQNEPYSTTSSC